MKRMEDFDKKELVEKIALRHSADKRIFTKIKKNLVPVAFSSLR